MTTARNLPLGIAVLTALAATVLSGPATAASAEYPVVVELFQSQGCSSCPPANAMLNRLADRADLLPLNFGVTYWDRLDWKDKFAHPAYTERQWDYLLDKESSQILLFPSITIAAASLVLLAFRDEDRWSLDHSQTARRTVA